MCATPLRQQAVQREGRPDPSPGGAADPLRFRNRSLGRAEPASWVTSPRTRPGKARQRPHIAGPSRYWLLQARRHSICNTISSSEGGRVDWFLPIRGGSDLPPAGAAAALALAVFFEGPRLAPHPLLRANALPLPRRAEPVSW